MNARMCVGIPPGSVPPGMDLDYRTLEDLWCEQFDVDGQPVDERTDENVDDSKVWTANGEPILMDLERAGAIITTPPDDYLADGTETDEAKYTAAITDNLTRLAHQGYITLDLNAGTITLLRSQELVRDLPVVRH